MAKWIVLAVGVFLFFNGIMSRTYSYSEPDRYCWQMDYISLHSCFSSPLGAQAVVWGATLLGAALIVGCFLYGRRKRA
jgi:hypothetical protein